MHAASFNIRTPHEFFQDVVLPQYEDFIKCNSSVRHALLALLVAYHMYEWAHPGKVPKKHFAGEYPQNLDVAESFEIARKIANGTKHFKSRIRTRAGPGFSSAFSEGFARPLNVEVSDGREESVDQILRRLIEFWKKQDETGTLG